MNRQVTVYEAALNGKVTVLENVEATTLGDLKQIMLAKGIDITNMDFMEGVSNVVLRDDSTILPSNIPYKGTTTNDLFIYLSLKNKKIASGMDRKEAYSIIKENCMENSVKLAFGKNFTQVSTAELERFIQENEMEKLPEPEVAKVEKTSIDALYKALNMLINSLEYDGVIYGDEANDIKEVLRSGRPAPAEPESVFKDDIKDFISKF